MTKNRFAHEAQLGLLQVRAERDPLESIPKEARRRVVRLIAQLLSEHVSRNRAAGGNDER